MEQLGAHSAFGVDHVRSKQCMSQIVIADLCTPQGVSLLWQWLAQENVEAIFLAPPCGSSSRACHIPLKRTMGKNSHGPMPRRHDLHPNGKPGLSFRDRQRVSLANMLYHLTSQLVQWANDVGCIVCVENPQFSQRLGCRWQSICSTAFFIHVNMEEQDRRKPCWPSMLMFFMQCRGLGRNEKKFATSEETAYPMSLAKMFATCIVLALINLGIKAPEETMHQLKATSFRSKQQMKAATGLQPKASRIPPLVPTFKARIKLQAMSELLPDFQLYQKCKQNLKLDAPNDPVLPKGAKLLSIQPAKTLSVGGARISLCRRFY